MPVLVPEFAIGIPATGSSSNCDVPRRVMPFDGANPPATLDGSLVLVGPTTPGTTPAPVPNPITGLFVKSSFDDWYYRVHLYPGTLELGNLVGNQQRDITVWNAFFNTITLNDFELINGAGINVTEPVVTPYTMKPLEDIKYQFAISANGPPVINATARWTIDGEEFDVPITGRRVVLMPFKPNWSGSVDETIECLTTVSRSFDNTAEQVFDIRGKGPRRIMQYQVRLHENDANIFDNLIFGWQGRVYADPLWHEETNLQAAVAAGGITLNVDTVGRTFPPGSTAVMYRSPTDYELIEVLSSTPTVVTLARPLESNWAQGAEVIPVMIGYLEAVTSTRRASDTHLDALLRFTSSPADNYPRFEPDAAPLTYRGEELYVGKTNWVSPLQSDSESPQITFGANQTGIFRVTRRATFPILRRGYGWLKKNKTVSEELRKFFARRIGRQKNVWLSSGVRDFQILFEASDTESSFKVKDTQYGSLVNMHPARCHLLIEMRNGTHIARQILDYQLDSLTGDGIVSVDSAFGQVINPQNVKRISFLGLYRMTSDSVTFSWRSVQVCQVEADFTLKQPT